MKAAAVLSLLILAPTGYAASAAPFQPSGFTDIDVVAVTPRSPDVKPLVMAVFTKEQLERAAAFQKSGAEARALNQGR
jgi:hypothetical protein